jgi:hypothetical protein
MSKYIEVHYPNSLIYIGFATHSNDITLHLLKYISNDEDGHHEDNSELRASQTDSDELNEDEKEEFTDKGHFKLVLKLERIDSSITPVKLVLFVQEPGTYKLIFDNTFSWFTSKTIRYRLSVLRPLSEIDVERRVDFELLKKEMNKDFNNFNNKLTENYDNEDVNASSSSNNIHSNKILMVKYEGRNRAFKVDKIFNKENKIISDPKYLTVPVLLGNKKMRIYQQDEDYLQYDLTEDVSLTFERKLEEYFNAVNDFENKTVFLNVFVIERGSQNDNSVIPINNDEFVKSVCMKIGFYPENLLHKFKNVKFFVNNLADSCLLYSLYQKIIDNVPFENIIHLHFDRFKAQPTFFLEGVINDKISGFVYDYTKSLIENVDNVIEFVNKVVVIFGSFEMIVSFSDFEEK